MGPETSAMNTARRIWLLSLALGLLVYLSGYVCLRLRHDFVRDATRYTEDGRIVHTDRIRLGEWRWGEWYAFLDGIYLPVRTAEGYAWRIINAWRDGGKVGWCEGP